MKTLFFYLLTSITTGQALKCKEIGNSKRIIALKVTNAMPRHFL